MNNKPSFWTNPNGFSILDLLAIIYTSIFIIILVMYIKYPVPSIKEVIGYVSPLIYIILSGYFTGQAVQQFKSASSYQSTNYSAPVVQQPVIPIVIPTNTATPTSNNDVNMSV